MVLRTCSESSVVAALVAAAGLLVLHSAARSINSFAGPFISNVRMFRNCEPGMSDGSWDIHIRSSHYNPLKPKKLQTLTGNITSRMMMNDSVWVHVQLDSRSNNQWKTNAFVAKFPQRGCTEIRTNVPGFFRLFFKLPPGSSCIVREGVYTVDNEPVDWTFPKVPVMPYGLYRFTLTSGYPGAKMPNICLLAEIQVIPKT